MLRYICIVTLVVFSLLLSACGNDKTTSKSDIKQEQPQKIVKKVDNSSEAKSVAEQFFVAFCRGDAATSSSLCFHEKRILTNVNKEKFLAENSHIFAETAKLYSQTTGIKTGFSSAVSKPLKIDENHYQVRWTFSIGGDSAYIPDITVARINGKWLVDFESFAIPFTQLFTR